MLNQEKLVYVLEGMLEEKGKVIKRGLEDVEKEIAELGDFPPEEDENYCNRQRGKWEQERNEFEVERNYFSREEQPVFRNIKEETKSLNETKRLSYLLAFAREGYHPDEVFFEVLGQSYQDVEKKYIELKGISLIRDFIESAQKGPDYSLSGPHETGLGDLEMTLELDGFDLNDDIEKISSLLRQNRELHRQQDYISELIEAMNKLANNDYSWQEQLRKAITQVEEDIPKTNYWNHEVLNKHKISYENLKGKAEELAALLEMPGDKK